MKDLITINCPRCHAVLLKAGSDKGTFVVKCIKCKNEFTVIGEINWVVYEIGGTYSK